MKAIAFSLGTCTPLMTIERPEGEAPASLVPLQAPLLGRPHRSDMPHVVVEVQSGSGGQAGPPVLATPLEALPVLATPLVAVPLEPVPVPTAPLVTVPLFADPLDTPVPLLVTDPALEAPVLAPPPAMPPVLAPLPPPPPSV